jgi:O-methyltransferase
MRAALKAYGDTERRLWLADSFAGLPRPDEKVDTFGWKEGDMSASLGLVRQNFARYGLLDDQVRFLPGMFADTLPTAPVSRLSILRVDADLYASTMDALSALYPRLSPGGYAIFDDYRNLKDCRQAIDEYRALHNISEPIVAIDRQAVYWQKSGNAG